jgi:hypothetical protein
MKLIKQFNDWSSLNEYNDDEIAAIARNAQGYKPGGTPNNKQATTTTGFNPDTTQLVTKDLGAAMFANSIDKIDISSPEFKSAVEAIRSAIYGQGAAVKTLNEAATKIDVEVAGGASAVGGKSADGKSAGYDNAALADRRRDNFIAAVKTALGNDAQYVNFVTKPAIVGTATVKDSDEAKKEQKVQIKYPDLVTVKGSPYRKDTTAVDATMVAIGNRGRYADKIPVDPNPKPGPEKSKMMIVKIFYKGDKAEFKKKILQGTGSPARELLDYNQAKGLKFES